MMEYNEFKSKCSILKHIQSKQGKNYVNIRVLGDTISFQRADASSPTKIESINLHSLYSFFCSQTITTSAAKKYGLSGKQSPAVAIIHAINETPHDKFNVNSVIKPISLIDTSSKVESFPPIEDTMSEILILGTAPGRESLLIGEYYASNRNSMWKIIASVYNDNIQFNSYDEKLKCLHDNHIALWDVYSHCNRKDSLDANITDAQTNNLADFIKSHNNIKLVLLNGKEAFEAFERCNIDVPHKYVTSTSNSNPKSIEDKIIEWRRALNR